MRTYLVSKSAVPELLRKLKDWIVIKGQLSQAIPGLNVEERVGILVGEERGIPRLIDLAERAELADGARRRLRGLPFRPTAVCFSERLAGMIIIEPSQMVEASHCSQLIAESICSDYEGFVQLGSRIRRGMSAPPIGIWIRLSADRCEIQIIEHDPDAVEKAAFQPIEEWISGL